MFNKLIRKVFGSKNKREIKRMGKLVDKVNRLEDDLSTLNDEQLKAKTAEFRQRLSEGQTLESLIPEAFAVVREASKRTLGLRHFDVQLIGGLTLHEGRIAEMRTGEGKTLVSTLPAYLHALVGSVHIVTVNDYLASRDAKWMTPIYEFLGMSVGVVYSMQELADKQAAYQADVTYGTNNEFGFDYLRDNMSLAKEDRVQRPLHFAIIDEVDSILIDEARTPLIISGQVDNNAELYRTMNGIIPQLTGQPISDEKDPVIDEGVDFTIDEKQRQIELTEKGHQRIEELLIKAGLLEEDESLYAATNLSLLHHIHSALKAHSMFQKDVDYIVEGGEVLLIDEHTGRTMPGRRLSEGLHQAIEAKEALSIQNESQTMASTTFQNYFRLYPTLSGMTGTADTEAFEFRQIYSLDVVVIPTNQEVQRKDLNDLVYLTIEEKYDAIVEDIKKYKKDNAPILVGTASVESSEALSKRLDKDKLTHNVLNAKFHEKEAEIVAQAGRPGAVTIATNMAGRGTDIVLGGNLQVEIIDLGEDATEAQIKALKADWQKRHDIVMVAGGLHILGTERHESRRIDNQLRGRAGRQGDPGLSRFYLSMEDNLMRIFASDRVRNFMQALGMEKGEAIEHRMVSNAIEKAQRKVEGRNFDIRKQLLEFDDVSNDQRQVIYSQRNEILEAESIRDVVTHIRRDVVVDAFSGFVPPQSMSEQWEVNGLQQYIESEFDTPAPIQEWLDSDAALHEESLRDKLVEAIQDTYDKKCERLSDSLIEIEKQVMLQVLDMQWKDHLFNMDHLRQGIGLRAYAQKNPKQEYKRESFELFQSMLQSIKEETVRIVTRVEPVSEERMAEMEAERRRQMEAEMQMLHADSPSLIGDENVGRKQDDQTFVRDGKKVGRNEPCPCGSGKKYKQCHGKL
ncbi:MAG: preprotein translocase subunit SecA [Candidatus Endobugula sp.]|jgi:preprotein translocase subunit SecA